jgi:hypothetical protein
MRNKEREMKAKLQQGLNSAVVLALGKMKPVTPVRTGNLVNSFFIEPAVQVGPGQFQAGIGNKADYAAPVHEMPTTYNFTKPGTGPKFMERPLRENEEAIIAMIHARVREAT